MSTLCVPLDYEQLPEMWRLRKALSAWSKSDVSPKQIEQAATFIIFRLFVTLGYIARSTNEPGLLPKDCMAEYLSSLEPLFGEDCNVIQMLEGAQLLSAREDGWFCHLFATNNPHLAGNYKRACDKGNVNSRISAALKKVQEGVAQQCLLFPPAIFQDESGHVMTDTESRRAMVLIQMLDRCLDQPQRGVQAFTSGVMAAACNIVRRYDNERLREFYFRLANRRDHPATPRTAEGIMREFDKQFAI